MAQLARWFKRLFCCAPPRAGDGEQVDAAGDDVIATLMLASNPKEALRCVPKAIAKLYPKIIEDDVKVEGQGVCITSNVAVLGNVAISAGGTCVTGNVLVVGDITIDGKDEWTVNGVCITGNVVVLGNVTILGHVCVTKNVFVQGDLKIQGSLKAQGKVCVWGQEDIRPLPPSAS